MLYEFEYRPIGASVGMRNTSSTFSFGEYRIILVGAMSSSVS